MSDIEIQQPVDCECTMCGAPLSADRNPTYELKSGQVCFECYHLNLTSESAQQIIDLFKPDPKLKIMQDVLQMIVDLGYDYDGYEEAEDLKELIDEFVEMSRNALNSIPLPEPIPLDGSGAFDKWLHGEKR